MKGRGDWWMMQVKTKEVPTVVEVKIGAGVPGSQEMLWNSVGERN